MPVLKGNKSLYKYEVSDILAYNLVEWLDYGLLEAGGYTPVTFNSPISGYTNLKKVKQDGYLDGQIYEGFGPSWAWTSGLIPNDGVSSPIFQVSGVLVNGAFKPSSGVGQYAHTIDYLHGRVVFNSPVSGSVKCQYVIKDVSVKTADTPNFAYITDEYARRYNDLDNLGPVSGMAEILKQNRVWLPAVFIEVQDISFEPLQLGGGKYDNFNVFYHIFAEEPAQAKSLVDIISDQQDITFNLYNINTIPKTYYNTGALASGAKSYPQLADRNSQYFWRNAFIERSTGRSIINTYNIFRGIVKQSIKLTGYGFE